MADYFKTKLIPLKAWATKEEARLIKRKAEKAKSLSRFLIDSAINKVEVVKN